MESKQWSQVRQLFEASLDLPEDERLEHIKAKSASDDVKSGALALLASSRGDTSIFDPPTATPGFEPVSPSLNIPQGTRIDQYLVDRRIGAGGMADVFAASQERPTRKVALKVMRGGLSERATKRFLFEAEVLGQLTHPAIAQVLAANETQIGEGVVPYIAMEHVDEAEDILSYAQHHILDRRQRLELFIRFADAIQFGHEHGVLHRDIKPSNLLVSGDGHPKVIDYGIARAELDQEQDHTRTGEVFGTIGYLAPERLRGDQGADIRSEVYSLAVVFFELVTGERPVDLKGLSFVDAVERMQHLEPPRASSVLGSVPEGLDWICIKALAIDRERRYASVGEFTADLQRFLSGESVLAGAPSTSYRLRSWLRRNRVVTALVFLALLGTIATIVGTQVGLRKAEDQAKIAEEQRGIAERQTVLAQQKTELAEEQTQIAQEQTRAAERQADLNEAALGVLEGTLKNANQQMGGVDARLSSVLDILDSEIEQRFAKEPRVAIRMEALLASAYLGSGDLQKAKRVLARVQGKRGGRAFDYSVLEAHQAYVLQLEGDFKGSEAAFIKILADIPREGTQAQRSFRLHRVRALLGILLSQGRAKEAVELGEEEVQNLRDDLPQSPRVALLRYLGDAYRISGNAEKAMESFRSAITLARTSDHSKYELLTSLRSAGLAEINLSHTDEAKVFLEEATALAESFLGDTHPDTAITAQIYSNVFMRTGEYESALEIIERLLQMPAYAKLPDRSKAMTEDSQIYVLSLLGRGEDALAAAESMMESSVAKLPLGDPLRLDCEASYAQALVASDRTEEAITVMEDVLKRAIQFHGPQSRPTFKTEHLLMPALLATGKEQRVLEMTNKQIAFLTGKVSPNGTLLWNAHQGKVQALLGLDRLDECQRSIDEMRSIMDLESAPRHLSFIDQVESQVKANQQAKD